jgi:hypothetical protein
MPGRCAMSLLFKGQKAPPTQLLLLPTLAFVQSMLSVKTTCNLTGRLRPGILIKLERAPPFPLYGYQIQLTRKALLALAGRLSLVVRLATPKRRHTTYTSWTALPSPPIFLFYKIQCPLQLTLPDPPLVTTGVRATSFTLRMTCGR